MGLSVVEPFTPAWQRMIDVCFRPFQFTKWLALGFCSFLSTCGTQGFNSSYNYSSPSSSGRGPSPFDPIARWIEANVGLAILIGVAIFVFGFCVNLVLLWLRCRGKFMLLDGIAQNRSLIAQPWREYKS